MTKVYVVATGSYSDYGVVGVCSTLELAEKSKLLYNSDNPILEFELDEIPECPPGKLPYDVVMNQEGEVRCVERAEIGFQELEWRKSGYKNETYFSVFATDEQHAVKIANEKRAQLIASGEWEMSFESWYKKYIWPNLKRGN